LGRIAWIDRGNLDTGTGSFISDEFLELIECPGVMQTPLGLAQTLVGAIAYPFKIFERNGLTGFFGRLDDVFADALVDVLLVAAFLL